MEACQKNQIYSLHWSHLFLILTDGESSQQRSNNHQPENKWTLPLCPQDIGELNTHNSNRETDTVDDGQTGSHVFGIR